MHSKVPALLLLVLAGGHSSDPDSAPRPESLAVNLGLAVGALFGPGNLWLVGASEAGEGRDLDGDGDRTGLVLHLLDVRTGALTNTGLAFPDLFQIGTDLRPPRFGGNATLAVFQISEKETGRDLDGDGIPGEVSTWILDRRTGVSRDLSFEHVDFKLGDELVALTSRDATGTHLHVFDARDGSLTTLPLEVAAPVAVHGSLVFFTRNEDGAFDLNADGDADDYYVLHIYDADSGGIENTTLNSGQVLQIQDDFAAFNVWESDQGQDLNGDGYGEDEVFVALDLESGELRIPGITGASFVNPSVALSGESKAFFLKVPEQEHDRNGDGDTDDAVALFYSPRSDRIFDTAIGLEPSSMFSFVQAGSWIGVNVPEWDHGLDLDHDGRLSSVVPQVFDSLTGESVNSGLRGVWLAAFGEQFLGLRVELRGAQVVLGELFALDPSTRLVRRTGVDARTVLGSWGDSALVIANETKGDLNGDGDKLDHVFAIYGGKTGTVRSLRLAAGGDGLGWSTSGLAPGGRAVVTVSEAGQGVDLNGDGDQLDLVLHEILLDPRSSGSGQRSLTSVRVAGR